MIRGWVKMLSMSVYGRRGRSHSNPSRSRSSASVAAIRDTSMTNLSGPLTSPTVIGLPLVLGVGGEAGVAVALRTPSFSHFGDSASAAPGLLVLGTD